MIPSVPQLRDPGIPCHFLNSGQIFLDKRGQVCYIEPINQLE